MGAHGRKGKPARQNHGNFAIFASTMADFLNIFLLAILGSFILRTVGFGFGIFIMTVLPFLMPSYGEATCLSGMLAMTTSIFVVYRMRHYLNWAHLLPILTTFLVVSSLTIFSLKEIDDHVLRKILGVVLIVIALYFTFFSHRIKLRPNTTTQVSAGTLSGLLGGFFGMQGPPAVLYFLSTEKDKDHYMAIIQAYLLAGNTGMLIVRAMNGFLTPTVGIDYLYGLGGVAIGALLGTVAFNRIPQQTFEYIVYAYIAVSGIMILVTA